MKILKNDWAEKLDSEFTKPYYLRLRAFLKQAYQSERIYPLAPDIFNALHYTSLANTKVVILGQDPYHGPRQAHGLSFSVQRGITPPPSLRNIYQELQDDLGCTIPKHGDLTQWAKQGVLLLNTVLTVQEYKAHSHKEIGWEFFTDKVIEIINEKKEPVVFILWGSHAHKKSALITNPLHAKIRSVHPSPLSAYRGFMGSKPFSRTNEFLRQAGRTEIDWQLPN